MEKNKLSHKVWHDPAYFIAFGFGSGLLPRAPGTWGTLAAIPIYWFIAQYSNFFYLCFSLIAFLLGVWASNKVCRELGIHDYSGIVWDEVVGFLLTMFMAPKGVLWIIIGFFLFRFFDIWKPQPIRLIDKRVKGGLGVMLDDVLAAIPAGVILHLIAWSLAR